jgi:PAS domain-containing protein
MDKSQVLFADDIAAEKLLNNLLKVLPVPVCIFTGSEFLLTLANPAAFKLFGKNRRSIGLTFDKAFPELKGQKFKNALRKVYTEGCRLTGVPFETEMEIKEEVQLSYFHFSFEPLYDSENQLYAVMATGIDVTEQLINEKKARLSQANFSNAILQSPIAIASFS